jgi:type IV pilus assembly protein PilN
VAHINLLPWREQAEKAKQRKFITLLSVVAFFAFLIIFLFSQFYQLLIEGQQTRNQYLTNEIAVLDDRIAKIKTLKEKKRELEKRTIVIEELQQSRNVGTQVLNEIAKVVPTGIYLTRMEKQGDSLQLIGKSESNNHLANMIREIEASVLFSNVSLESITSNDAQSKLLSDFVMRITIASLSRDDAEQYNVVDQQ